MDVKHALVVLSNHNYQCQGRGLLIPILEAFGYQVHQANRLVVPSKGQHYQLAFVDIAQVDAEFDELQPLTLQVPTIVFNANGVRDELENKALCQNIRGIFFQNDDADMVVKGIRHVAEGHLWYSRACMSQMLQKLLSKVGLEEKAALASNEGKILTKRERAIISLLSMGARNKEIAERLSISPHTVKTHLYSAFRKTKSRNRVELLTWAKSHLAD